MDDKKLALAACSGMSPYGLVARIACSDIGEVQIKPYPYACLPQRQTEKVSEI